MRNRIPRLLSSLYGRRASSETISAVLRLIDAHLARIRGPRPGSPTERDAILIAYPDMVREPGERPLRTLLRACRDHVGGTVSCVHLLPFFPSSSDDGFSVTDYRTVDPAFGDWEDIGRIGSEYRLMFDAVFNHASVQGGWFRGFVNGDPAFLRFFITVPEGSDLSGVVRPRAHPLLTGFDTAQGRRPVWTTFSADQADLNYAEPAVLIKMIETLLFYVERGASFIRLDAIGYIWKQAGTRCIHLPQAHTIVRLFRAVLDRAAPHVMLITETNVPHRENVSYFGNGANEAQLVYNFPLPPLTLHAFYTGSARALTRWAAGISTPSHGTTFLNFLASHDGIGVNPVRGILPSKDIDGLVQGAAARGAFISTRSAADGSEVPYELNINYWDALLPPEGGEALETSVDRFMAAHAILLALPGVPGLYFHSLFGSTGWREGALASGNRRAVNREKLEYGPLVKELGDPGGRRGRVHGRMRGMLSARSAAPCFHPHGKHRILFLHNAVFALTREAPGGGSRVLCLQNVSGNPATLRLRARSLYGFQPRRLRDIITQRIFPVNARGDIVLDPYGVAWLKGER